MGSRREPARSRALLVGWIAAAFLLSGVSDLRVLGAAAAAAALAFRAGLARTAGRVLRLAVLPTALLSLASWGWLRLSSGAPPPAGPFLALSARTAVIAFVGVAVLERVDLFQALAPWPAATRLLVVTLAQIHAVRLVVTDSLLGLRSRMLRRPGTLDVLRSAGALSGALFTLSARNARDVADAMVSRGFR